MDFLNKAYAQIGELFQGMFPGARIVSGLLLVTVVVSLLYLCTFSASSPGEYLLGARAVSDNELQSMEKAFSQSGLKNWDVQNNRIRVPLGKKHEYLAALADANALPHDFYAHIDDALKKSSVFRTNKHREVDIQFARQKDLSLIIRHMDGIKDATVSYDSVVQGGAFKKKTEVTAAVSVWPEAGAELDEQHVESVRKLLANSVGGLKADRVTVIDMSTGQVRFDGSGDGHHTDRNVYQMHKKGLQNLYATNIREALQFVEGAVVRVNVELEPTLDRQTHRVQLDSENAVAVQNRESTQKKLTVTAHPQGRPGLNSQGGVGNTAQRVSTHKLDERTTVDNTDSQITRIPLKIQTFEHGVGLTPKRVTVAVAVPNSYFEKIWHNKNPIPEGEELKSPPAAELEEIKANSVTQIENTVVNLLPGSPAEDDVYEPVKVTTFEDMGVPPPPSTPFTHKLLDWLTYNWSTLGMMLVGMVGLIMLRSMVRSIPSSTLPSVLPVVPAQQPSLSMVSPEDADSEQQTVDDGVSRLLKPKSKKGPNLRDELAEMVREDPAAAASVVSTWIGNIK